VRATQLITMLPRSKVPLISPAVVNALYRLTGRRYRALLLVTL